jgi:hypothetical protein
LGYYASHACRWSTDVRARPLMLADVVTQLETHRGSGLLLAALARPLLQLGLATLRPVTLVEVAARRALDCLVLAATAGRRWPTALPLLPRTHRPPPAVQLTCRQPACVTVQT